jgi:mannosyltransferase
MMLRRVLRPARRLPLWLILPIFFALFLEVCIHRAQYRVPAPDHDLDPPFFSSCQEPDVSGERENAALVMLARNAELAAANKTITSIDWAFNRFFNYPIVFMNDEPWDLQFIEVLNKTSRGLATFEVIPKQTWLFPPWVNEGAAKVAMKEQGARGLPHADSEGYHHMCRYYSG